MSLEVKTFVPGKANSAFDLSKKMVPFFDIHMMLPIFDWLEDSKMYKDLEIGKARVALLKHTNMVEYTIEEFKRVYAGEEVPETISSRVASVKKQHEFIMESNLYGFAEDCCNEFEETGKMPVVDDEELEGCDLNRSDLGKCFSYAKFLMDCGSYPEAQILLSFYLGQLSKSACKDLFQDRYVSCLWGLLACDLLLGNLEEAHGDIKQIEQIIQQNEAALPPAQILQCRCWLLHCGLFLLARHEEGVDLFTRTFLRREYLAAMEVACPWLIRYVVVLAVVSSRQNLMRVADMLDRLQESLEDPLLLFLHRLLICVDFEAAAAELSRCADVFATDFFLAARGEDFAASFMENAQFLVLEMLFPVHQSIAMDRLAMMVSMPVDVCEKWVKELIEKDVVKMTINEKGHVVMTKATPSVYSQVMEKSKELEKRVEELQKMLTPKA